MNCASTAICVKRDFATVVAMMATNMVALVSTMAATLKNSRNIWSTSRLMRLSALSRVFDGKQLRA
jgi:hypothetical protein